MSHTYNRDCVDCGVSLSQYRYHPDPENLPYCFSCFLQTDDDVREFNIEYQENQTQVEVVADKERGGMWRWNKTFSSSEEAEEFVAGIKTKIQCVLLLELERQDEYIIIGCRNKDDAEYIARKIKKMPFVHWIENDRIFGLDDICHNENLTDSAGQSLFSDRYCWNLAAWRFWRSAGSSLFDTQCIVTDRGILDETREEIQSWAVNYFKDEDGFSRVETLVDIHEVATEILPLTSDIFEVSYEIQSYARENKHLLSEKSQQSIENQRKGEKLELVFESVCEKYNLEYERGTRPGSFQWHLNHLQGEKPEYLSSEEYEAKREEVKSEYHEIPSHIREVTERIEDSSGIPDYIVWGDEERLDTFFSDLSEDIEREQDAVFIEVKYRDTDGNNRVNYIHTQRERIPELQDLGAEVYVFQGTPDNYWIAPTSL